MTDLNTFFLKVIFIDNINMKLFLLYFIFTLIISFL